MSSVPTYMFSILMDDLHGKYKLKYYSARFFTDTVEIVEESLKG